MSYYEEVIRARDIMEDFWAKDGATPTGADNRLLMINRCDIVLGLSSDPFGGNGSVTLAFAKVCAQKVKDILTS